MENKFYLFISFLISNLFVFGSGYKENITKDTITLNHEKFIEKLNNSENDNYKKTLKIYDSYLLKNSNDILVQIQKCKFVQNAQYDSYSEYNPNQEYLDSISDVLFKKYPIHPEVLLYKISLTWGEELIEIFKKGEEAINQYPENWSQTNLGDFYYEMANQYYLDDDFEEAAWYMKKSRIHSDKYKSSLVYIKILIELDQKEKALEALENSIDTTDAKWIIYNRANLFLKLKSYDKAIEGFNYINEIDSTYIDNNKIASALVGAKKYTIAREYLVKDTINHWNKKSKRLQLFLHDLNYQDKFLATQSYNAFRDLGYIYDPLSLYRLKLFFKYPFSTWKAHDILGILSLILVLLFLIILPSVWILPIYFIGHKWNFINYSKNEIFYWGLKSFWWVSAGYLIASFLSLSYAPENINDFFNDTNSIMEYTQNEEAKFSLIFIVSFAVFALFTLDKKNVLKLKTNNWSLYSSITRVIGYFIVFKIFTGIYLKIGMTVFDLSIEDITMIPKFILSSKAEVLALITTYGKVTAILIVGIFVPIYEEIIFRGIILHAVKRYIPFLWANIFQAFLFATIHGDLFLFPVFFGFGILTGYLMKKSDSLFPGIIFHMINNILVILVMIMKGA